MAGVIYNMPLRTLSEESGSDNSEEEEQTAALLRHRKVQRTDRQSRNDNILPGAGT